MRMLPHGVSGRLLSNAHRMSTRSLTSETNDHVCLQTQTNTQSGGGGEVEMTRIQLLVTYKGAAFLGFGALLKPNEEDPSHFLKQASSASPGSARCSELVNSGSWPSVQNVLEMALRLYLPHGLSTGVIVGSSRTDAGVCFPHPSFLHSFIHAFTLFSSSSSSSFSSSRSTPNPIVVIST